MPAKKVPQVGEVYNRLTVVEDAGQNQHRKTLVKCSCVCGEECVVLAARLRSGLTKSCGCLHRETLGGNSQVDYAGRGVGRLTLLQDVGSSKGARLWSCRCACGQVIVRRGCAVVAGQIQSCGCLRDDRIRETKTTHGMSGSREYSTYNSMISRCYDSNNEKYPLYGARGISVCERWLESFQSFADDMGTKPVGLTLERIDVNGIYEPDNCMWDTPTEQAYNQRMSKNNTSGHVGVSKNTSGPGWRATIWKSRVAYHLGRFKTFEEAVAAREAAELELYGYLKGRAIKHEIDMGH